METKMSRETAEAFGVAFAMWAHDEGAIDKTGIDAVAVEESDMYEAFCKEVAPNVTVDIFDESEHYRVMRERMMSELSKIAEHARKVM